MPTLVYSTPGGETAWVTLRDPADGETSQDVLDWFNEHARLPGLPHAAQILVENGASFLRDPVAGWMVDWEAGTVTSVQAAPTTNDVDAERDRRIDAGFLFGGKLYQSRASDRENIMGAYSLAQTAVLAGAQPSDYRWHGGDADFVWIAADNSETVMDAQTMMAFGQAALARKSAMIFAARNLKNEDPIRADYTDDGYWPGPAS